LIVAKKVLEKQKAHLQLKKHNYFNFAESKSEAEECASIRLVSSSDESHEERRAHTQINHIHREGGLIRR
jgi:hypothetical protein